MKVSLRTWHKLAPHSEWLDPDDELQWASIALSKSGVPATALRATYCAMYACALGLSWEPSLGLMFVRTASPDEVAAGLDPWFPDETYRGATQLAFASGHVRSVKGFTIRDGDAVRLSAGLPPQITFALGSERRGAILGGIGSVELADGQWNNVYINAGELSEVASFGTDAWNSPFVDAMVSKQAIWRALRDVPSVKQARLKLADAVLSSARSAAFRDALPTKAGQRREPYKPAGSTKDKPSLLALLGHQA